MDNIRQNKISRLIQKELSTYFQQTANQTYLKSLISVTIVRVTADLSMAKIYLSIFPPQKQDEVFELIIENIKEIRYELGQKVRHQLRKIPELDFYIDDSLDYAEKIENLLKKDKK